jgi:hypothetical protein
MESMKQNLSTLLFDLGGVLIELGPIDEMMATSSQNTDEIWRNWIQCSAVRDFESGQSSPVRFSEQMVSEFRMAITPAEFLGKL